MQKLSRLYIPALVTPKNAVTKPLEAVSKSQKLMTELGLVKPATNGTFHIMPLAQRSLDKLCHLVNEAMFSVEGQKCSLPVLTSSSLWKKSGRLKGDITEFFMLRDRHEKEFLLSPTHEESITSMLATSPLSYKQLPLRLFQIGPKFRDELKSRFGLMRAKEFLMKDMYTFDRTEDEARETYALVNDAYMRLFKQLEVPFKKVEASTGMMGGKLSHEYHYISSAGEDNLLSCESCSYAFNAEVSAETISSVSCIKCNSTNVKQVKGMEVAHTFLLGDRYTKVFHATYLDTDGKPKNLVMGCYGIGISRILAAALEVLSTESELKWPTLLAPYDVCVIGPKQGSKEAQRGDLIEEIVLNQLATICRKELLYDDRKYLTIGKRFMEAKKMGYPVILVVGSKSCETEPKVEVHINGKCMDLGLNDALVEISNYIKQKTDLIQM